MLWVGGIFAFLWASLLTWEFRFMSNVDEMATLALSRLSGASETFDLTMVFLARVSGTWTTAFLFLVILVLVSETKRRGHRFNLPSYLAFLLVMGFLSGMLVEAIDHYVQRPSPSVALPGFVSSSEVLGVNYNPPNRTHFPDTRLAIFSTLMFLAFFRLGVRMLLFGAWLILLAVSDLLEGNSWPIDSLGAFMFGWLFTSLVYVLGINHFYRKLESSTGKQIAETMRSASLWVQRQSRKIRFWGKTRRITLSQEEQDSLRDEQRVLLSLHYGLDQVKLLAPPHKGKLFPISANGTPYALKKTRLGADDSADLEETLQIIHSLREENAVVLPRIFPTAERRLSCTSGDRCFYLMEWMTGKPLSFENREHVAGLMSALGAFHAKTAIAQSEKEAADELKKQIAVFQQTSTHATAQRNRFLNAIMPENTEHAQQLETLQLLQAECAIIARSASVYLYEDNAPLSLCQIHRDIHPMNFLYDEEKGVVILDFDRIREGLAVMDLGFAFHRACRASLWSFPHISEYLHAYQQANPLTRCELAFLLAFVLSPTPPVKALREFTDPSKSKSSNRKQRKKGIAALPLLSQIEQDLVAAFTRQYSKTFNLDLLLLLADRESGTRRQRSVAIAQEGAEAHPE